eukprot:1130297-Rhodomonas_salina.11
MGSRMCSGMRCVSTTHIPSTRNVTSADRKQHTPFRYRTSPNHTLFKYRTPPNHTPLQYCTLMAVLHTYGSTAHLCQYLVPVPHTYVSTTHRPVPFRLAWTAALVLTPRRTSPPTKTSRSTIRTVSTIRFVSTTQRTALT